MTEENTGNNGQVEAPEDTQEQPQVSLDDMSEEQLMEALQSALDAKDFAQVRRISQVLAKKQQEIEKAQKEQRQAAREALSKKVKAELDKAFKKIVDALTAEELEVMDGVWYSRDFGDTLSACRVVKAAPGAKKSGGGGGGGQKIPVSSKDLLEKFGGEVYDSETGQTFNEAWAASTDGNWRFGVRKALLKKGGYI